MLEAKYTINIIIRAKSAESGPPLGTVLGNVGVNTVKFVKEFNEFTNELPEYFKIKVKIFIFKNNSYSFKISEPTIGYILSILRKEDLNGNFYIDFKDLLKLALFKFPKVDLKKSIKIVLGSVTSLNNTYIYINLKNL